MEKIKVQCTDEDIRALKLLYYFILVQLKTGKGLVYRNAFTFQKRLNDLKKEVKNYDLDELMEVIDNE